MKLNELVKKAEGLFNKYRAPEAVAKVIDVREGEIVVEFKGTFCKTCGFYDYFDDFSLFLEEVGVKNKVSEVEEVEDGAVVKFRIAKRKKMND